MIFNSHSRLDGSHAFLSASKYHWINYDDDKLARVFAMSVAAARGTRLHDLAHQLIREGVALPDTSATLNKYVNDCLGFRMVPEQILYYSDNCFGTADACNFRDNTLRIFDLKTGATPASVHQLEVYAALFCLEYRMKPFEIEMDLRIYQNDEVVMFEADLDDIMHIMDKIKSFDRQLTEMRMEAL